MKLNWKDGTTTEMVNGKTVTAPTESRLVVVMNVMTEEKMTYYNNRSLDYNLVSSIILTTEDKRKQWDLDYRDEILATAKIESIQSINGSIKAYSPLFDMIAYLG